MLDFMGAGDSEVIHAFEKSRAEPHQVHSLWHPRRGRFCLRQSKGSPSDLTQPPGACKLVLRQCQDLPRAGVCTHYAQLGSHSVCPRHPRPAPAPSTRQEATDDAAISVLVKNKTSLIEFLGMSSTFYQLQRFAQVASLCLEMFPECIPCTTGMLLSLFLSWLLAIPRQHVEEWHGVPSPPPQCSLRQQGHGLTPMFPSTSLQQLWICN